MRGVDDDGRILVLVTFFDTEEKIIEVLKENKNIKENTTGIAT